MQQLPGGMSVARQQLAAAGNKSSIEAGVISSPASEAAERAAVDYLMQHVLTGRPERHCVKDAILGKPGAKNATVAAFRNMVKMHLASSGFKERWNALKARVSADD